MQLVARTSSGPQPNSAYSTARPTRFSTCQITPPNGCQNAKIFAFWQPLGGVIWHVENRVGRAVLYALFGCGPLLVLATSCMINHFDLFGVRQVWLHLRGQGYTDLKFGTPGLYKYVRHPLYIGWFLTVWATPTMTVAHLVFALGTTLYILLALRWEERDLVAFLPE